MLLRAFVSGVRGDYFFFATALISAAVCGGQSGRAFFQVPRFIATLRRTTDRQCVNTIRVAVARTRVVEATTVARRPYINRAEAVSTLFDVIKEYY